MQDTKDQDEVEPTFYPSNVPGVRARNAVDGSFYDYLTGSSEAELRLFQVTVATGCYDADGRWTREPCRDPHRLYYDSPDQYYAHRRPTRDPAMSTINADWAASRLGLAHHDARD